MIETRLLILRAIPILLLTSYRDQNKCLNLCEPQFLHLQNGSNHYDAYPPVPLTRSYFLLARVGLQWEKS